MIHDGTADRQSKGLSWSAIYLLFDTLVNREGESVIAGQKRSRKLVCAKRKFAEDESDRRRGFADGRKYMSRC